MKLCTEEGVVILIFFSPPSCHLPFRRSLWNLFLLDSKLQTATAVTKQQLKSLKKATRNDNVVSQTKHQLLYQPSYWQETLAIKLLLHQIN